MKRKSVAQEQEEILQEAIKSKKGVKAIPKIIPIIVASIIIILMILWIIPINSIPIQLRPGKVPNYEEVVPNNLILPTRPQENINNINYYKTPTEQNIKLISARIVTQSCARNEAHCYADALYYFVRDQINYVNDPIEEYYELPIETLMARSADCDGKSILLASMMESVGIKTRFKFIPKHVYLEAWLPEKNIFAKEYYYKWKSYDATCSSCRPGETLNR